MIIEKITAIVTCCNCADSLANSIGFLQDQTFSNLEIICVDDGSEDETPLILSELAKYDPRITIISQSRKGLSEARNAGIKKATGEYLFFVDDDDWLKPDFVETLASAASDTQADIVSSRNLRLMPDGESIASNKIVAFSDAEYFRMLLIGYAANSSWARLWRRSIFDDAENLFFPGLIHEDMDHTYRVLAQGFKHKRLDYCGYMWNFRDGSLSRQMSEKHLLSFFSILERVDRYLGEDQETEVMLRFLGIWATVFKKLDEMTSVREFMAFKLMIAEFVEKNPHLSWSLAHEKRARKIRNARINQKIDELVVMIPSDLAMLMLSDPDAERKNMREAEVEPPKDGSIENMSFTYVAISLLRAIKIVQARPPYNVSLAYVVFRVLRRVMGRG
mgnify:FL=1